MTTDEMHSNMWSWDELAEAYISHTKRIAELESARKVADAAVAYFDCEDVYESDAWVVLSAAVLEYRKCCKSVADKKEEATEASPVIPLIAKRN